LKTLENTIMGKAEISRMPGRSYGFTLTEILVAIAIVGVLMAILIPSLIAVRKSSEVSSSVARMRSVGEAFMLFVNDNQGRLPAAGGGAADGGALQRWVHQVAPYLGYEADRSHNGVPLYSGGYNVKEFMCPALSGRTCPLTGERFIALYGYNSMLAPEVTDASGNQIFGLGLSLAAISDPARTVMLATKADGAPGLRPQMFPNHPWGVAANFRSDRNPRAANVSTGEIGSHAYIFCDGHVEVREEFIGAAAFTVN
jgi:prepilin-type N-terminal cleavage/methylation domain-containing protein